MGERIQKIEFTTVRVPLRPRPEKHMSRGQPNWGISELCAISGESGLTGWGETIVHYTWGRPDRDRAAELVGRDPFELLWDDGLGAGVQMALWDLAGQAAGVPCHRLAGGQIRGETPLAWWCIDMPPEDWEAEAKEAVASGYTAMKIKGRPWFDLVDQLDAVCSSAPGHLKLDVDFNDHLNDIGTAVSYLRMLEERFDRLAIWESPIPQRDVEGNRLLRRRISLPIAMHFGTPQFLTALAGEVCDGFVISGGASRVLREGTLAAEANKPFWLQLVGTGLTTAWAAHLGAVLSHARWPAVTCLNIYADDLVGGDLAVRGGFLKVPEGPGLGITPSAEAIERYRVPEGTVVEWPRRIYTVSWPHGRRVHYAGYRQYVDDFLAGNQPLFEREVSLGSRDDDGTGEFKRLFERANARPVVEQV